MQQQLVYPEIGGRRLKPAFDPISHDPASPDELRASEKLLHFMSEASPQENDEEQKRRGNIVAALDGLFKGWVKSVCLSKGLSQEVADKAGGLLFTSGSYRLGIAERAMDIDTICVVPRHVTREDFFSNPTTSLKVILEDHPSVTNLVSVEGATVPLITFDFDDINIDLLFAQVPVDSVPPDFDINDDSVLSGVDVGTEKSLNGPRVTEMVCKLVPNFESSEEVRKKFLLVVRCVRLWAKTRGLYSNKMGYIGGVNCNLLVTFICQLYPHAAASKLLERFFGILKNWNWPTPVMLTPPYDAGLGLEVWDPQFGNNRFHVMPILTPAYPSMNSTMSVQWGTLETMRKEMEIGHEKVLAALERGSEGWGELFEEPDFLVAHQKYLAVEIYATKLPPHEHKKQLDSWTGLVESRLRKLTDMPYLATLPLANIRLWPKKQPLLTVKNAQDGAGKSYLIGFDLDKERMQGNELHLNAKVDAFKEEVNWTAMRQNIVTEETKDRHLRLKFSHFNSWKELPDVALAPLGGRDRAKALRKKLVAQRTAAALAETALGDGTESAAAAAATSAQPTGGAPAPVPAPAPAPPAAPVSRDPRLAADPRLRADPRRQQRAEAPSAPAMSAATPVAPAATVATVATAATSGLGEAKQEASLEANGAAPPAKRAADDALAGAPTKVIRTSSFQGPELMNGSHGVSMIGDSPDVNGTERRAVAPSRGKMKLTLEGDL